jgi:hypothetical protein
MRRLACLVISIGVVTTVSSCNRGVYLVAQEPVPLFQSPADAISGARPTGEISAKERVEVVDCLDMKGQFVLEVVREKGAGKAYVMNGKYNFNKTPYCHD